MNHLLRPRIWPPLMASLADVLCPDEEVTGEALEQSASGASAQYHPAQFGTLRVAPR